MISVTERDFITKGIDCAIRADGRSRLDYREFKLETGMINQASGSCRVTLEGGTDVLVGVKVEVGSIEPDLTDADDDDGAPAGVEAADDVEQQAGTAHKDRDRGRIVCNVDCSPSATRVFDPRDVENMCNEYSQFMNRVLNGPQGGVNLKALCIIPGSTCWILNIDALVLDYGGNLLDAIFMATRGALHNTRIPKATVEQSDGRVEFDIADEETEIVEGWQNVPVSVTLSKIAYRHIIDATPLEELCASAHLTVAVNKAENLCALQKGGKGGVEPSLLAEMVQTGKQQGQTLLRRLDQLLAEEEQRIANGVDPVGFR
ncbi:ribosomal protein S5 domain 2-type protein [Fimicolochytrium jonesii]|uniref:ribosomal protein S5 domain 2-type protein n=1 Tax=Fimicolochytrium jonesii TaxID=1396493 RepID=UPI0022FDB51F|nr:ribosomal protein S5 domain 2-type protein [Fimicolochytrium jonesii]KAI8825686.1 ribosomal protein S5 domain 2-type protein [Fimicolochytrium jonesii]